MHYHSKNLVKYPEEGGVWNWHQVRAALTSPSAVQKTMISFSQDYGYWYKDFFLTPDMMTAYFAIDRQTMANGCIKMLKGSNHLGRIDHGSCSSSLCSFFRSHKEAASTAGGSGIPSPERTP